MLLDGWPDLVFPIFKIIEPKLKKGTVIAVDDVEGFRPSMQVYLDYVRNPENGYISTTIKPKKGMEFTVKVKWYNPTKNDMDRRAGLKQVVLDNHCRHQDTGTKG